MAEMRGFGKMDVDDRGGKHDFHYPDEAHVTPEPGLTPSQTVGPFFAYGLVPGAYGYPGRDLHTARMAASGVKGERITVEGRVFDANGELIHDAMVEVLQANSEGRFVEIPGNDGFTGYGRAGTGAPETVEKLGAPGFRFETIKPGTVSQDAAPSLTIILTMRGLLNHYVTRMYFPGDDHTSDPVLGQVPAERRETLIAGKVGDGHYRFDIHMQGDKETVFFDL